jgi:hypothetical protein
MGGSGAVLFKWFYVAILLIYHHCLSILLHADFNLKWVPGL